MNGIELREFHDPLEEWTDEKLEAYVQGMKTKDLGTQRQLVLTYVFLMTVKNTSLLEFFKKSISAMEKELTKRGIHYDR